MKLNTVAVVLVITFQSVLIHALNNTTIAITNSTAATTTVAANTETTTTTVIYASATTISGGASNTSIAPTATTSVIAAQSLNWGAWANIKECKEVCEGVGGQISQQRFCQKGETKVNDTMCPGNTTQEVDCNDGCSGAGSLLPMDHLALIGCGILGLVIQQW